MTLETYVTAGIPTLAIGLAVWGLRSWFEEIRTTLRALNEKVGGHGEKLSSHDARLGAVEQIITRHDLNNLAQRVTFIEARDARRRTR